MFAEIIIAGLFGIEILLVSVDTAYATAWFGKIIMQIFSVLFIVFYCLAYKLFFDYNEMNLPTEERNLREEIRRKSTFGAKRPVTRI